MAHAAGQTAPQAVTARAKLRHAVRKVIDPTRAVHPTLASLSHTDLLKAARLLERNERMARMSRAAPPHLAALHRVNTLTTKALKGALQNLDAAKEKAKDAEAALEDEKRQQTYDGAQLAGDLHFYTPEQIHARKKLRQHKRIEELLCFWWHASSNHDDANDDGFLDRCEYEKLYYRLLRAFDEDDIDENDLTHEQAREAFEEDWRKDSGGDGTIDCCEFKDAIFELADHWCESTDAVEYIEYLEMMYSKVFKDLIACHEAEGAVYGTDVMDTMDASERHAFLGMTGAEREAWLREHRGDRADARSFDFASSSTHNAQGLGASKHRGEQLAFGSSSDRLGSAAATASISLRLRENLSFAAWKKDQVDKKHAAEHLAFGSSAGRFDLQQEVAQSGGLEAESSQEQGLGTSKHRGEQLAFGSSSDRLGSAAAMNPECDSWIPGDVGQAHANEGVGFGSRIGHDLRLEAATASDSSGTGASAGRTQQQHENAQAFNSAGSRFEEGGRQDVPRTELFGAADLVSANGGASHSSTAFGGAAGRLGDGVVASQGAAGGSEFYVPASSIGGGSGGAGFGGGMDDSGGGNGKHGETTGAVSSDWKRSAYQRPQQGFEPSRPASHPYVMAHSTVGQHGSTNNTSKSPGQSLPYDPVHPSARASAHGRVSELGRHAPEPSGKQIQPTLSDANSTPRAPCPPSAVTTERRDQHSQDGAVQSFTSASRRAQDDNFASRRLHGTSGPEATIVNRPVNSPQHLQHRDRAGEPVAGASARYPTHALNYGAVVTPGYASKEAAADDFTMMSMTAAQRKVFAALSETERLVFLALPLSRREEFLGLPAGVRAEALNRLQRDSLPDPPMGTCTRLERGAQPLAVCPLSLTRPAVSRLYSASAEQIRALNWASGGVSGGSAAHGVEPFQPRRLPPPPPSAFTLFRVRLQPVVSAACPGDNAATVSDRVREAWRHAADRYTGSAYTSLRSECIRDAAQRRDEYDERIGLASKPLQLRESNACGALAVPRKMQHELPLFEQLDITLDVGKAQQIANAAPTTPNRKFAHAPWHNHATAGTAFATALSWRWRARVSPERVW